MTIQEIEKRFKDGESLVAFFGIKKTTHSIGNTGITIIQYQRIRQKYKDRSKTTIDCSGMTRHITKYSILNQ